MKPCELFSPLGWLKLDDTQIDALQQKFGSRFDAIPLFDVVAIGPADIYIPLSGLPGLSGVVVRYGPPSSAKPKPSRIVASLVEQMISGADRGEFFAAHSKLLAPNPEAPPSPAKPAKT